MAGKRARSGRRPLEDLVRLACSTDPMEPESRPRRMAIAPRAAIVAGLALIALALLLALRAVALAPPGGDQGAGPTAGPSAATGAGAPPSGTPPPSPGAQGTPGHEGVHPPPPADPRAAQAPGTGQEAQPAVGPVVVHVAGAVRSPGVVTLARGARVADAIDAAGGATTEADTDQLNLARILSDGEQVRVPRAGEVLPTQEAAPGPTEPGAPGAPGAQGGAGAAAGTHAPQGRININTATASQLEELPGIGPALARRIVEHRDSHGPFASVEDLTDVPGIGQAKLEALRQEATV